MDGLPEALSNKHFNIASHINEKNGKISLEHFKVSLKI